MYVCMYICICMYVCMYVCVSVCMYPLLKNEHFQVIDASLINKVGFHERRRIKNTIYKIIYKNIGVTLVNTTDNVKNLIKIQFKYIF